MTETLNATVTRSLSRNPDLDVKDAGGRERVAAQRPAVRGPGTDGRHPPC